MNEQEANIFANNELSYYHNSKNIANQDLVTETIEYIKTGERKTVFEPLEFMNLLWFQYNFVKQNISNADIVITHLNKLPLTPLKKHILFGFILKWFGGYPVYNNSEDFDRTLKLIQKEFLNYPESTPEKEFCKVNAAKINEFMKLGIAATVAINNNVSMIDIYNAMPDTKLKTKVYKNFDSLFDAISNNLGWKYDNQLMYLSARSSYNYNFNIWLQEIKKWEYGNEKEYNQYLTDEIFIDFIESEKPKSKILDSETEKIKSTMLNAYIFDLTKYSLKTAGVFPYFKIILKEKYYFIYEGAIGNNRFQYFKVGEQSEAGMLCKDFINKYYTNNEYRHAYYEDGIKLISLSETESKEKEFGFPAYLKYWRDCLTNEHKTKIDFYAIQHFEALVEWYNLNLEKYIQENQNQYLNEDVKNADIKRWKNEKIKSLANYLKNSEITEMRKTSAISSAHANELIKFYNWINEREQLKTEFTITLSKEQEEKLNHAKEVIQNFENAIGKLSSSLKEDAMNTSNFHKRHTFTLPHASNPDRTYKEQNISAINLDAKPTFKTVAIQTIFDMLKDFFSKEDQNRLRHILETGNSVGEPLIFLDNGNRLADAFKQLKEKDFITGFEKQQLQNWIISNFKFVHNRKQKNFTSDYIEKCISRNYYPCKKPIFSIDKGIIVKNS